MCFDPVKFVYLYAEQKSILMAKTIAIEHIRVFWFYSDHDIRVLFYASILTAHLYRVVFCFCLSFAFILEEKLASSEKSGNSKEFDKQLERQ